MSLIRFACGHVGRTNNSPDAKVQTFIRVAEIRELISASPKTCPDCTHKTE